MDDWEIFWSRQGENIASSRNGYHFLTKIFLVNFEGRARRNSTLLVSISTPPKKFYIVGTNINSTGSLGYGCLNTSKKKKIKKK